MDKTPHYIPNSLSFLRKMAGGGEPQKKSAHPQKKHEENFKEKTGLRQKPT
jgi:hypothetical protein